MKRPKYYSGLFDFHLEQLKFYIDSYTLNVNNCLITDSIDRVEIMNKMIDNSKDALKYIKDLNEFFNQRIETHKKQLLSLEKSLNEKS